MPSIQEISSTQQCTNNSTSSNQQTHRKTSISGIGTYCLGIGTYCLGIGTFCLGINTYRLGIGTYRLAIGTDGLATGTYCSNLLRKFEKWKVTVPSLPPRAY